MSFERVWGADACAIAWPADVEAACGIEGAMVMLSPEDRDELHANYDRKEARKGFAP